MKKGKYQQLLLLFIKRYGHIEKFSIFLTIFAEKEGNYT